MPEAHHVSLSYHYRRTAYSGSIIKNQDSFVTKGRNNEIGESEL